MNGTAFFREQTENLFSELGGGARKAEEGVDVRGLLFSRGWPGGETKVKREAKRAADGRNAADNIGAINWAAIPGVSGCMGSLDEDSVGAAIIGGNSDGFI
jgi:hypothetical protein